MKNWQISAIAATLLILPLGTFAATPNRDNNAQESITTTTEIAQHMRHGKRGERSDRLNKMLQQLDLSSGQSEQIEAIKEQSKTSGEALHEQMQTQHQEMRSLLNSDATSAQLTQQHQQLQDLRQQLGDRRFETMLQVREILTPEQRVEMAELMAQKADRKGDRKQ